MPPNIEAVYLLALKLDPLVMDSSSVDVFSAAFGGPRGQAFHRAIASRICFLEWLALYSCVGKSADRWQTMTLAFYQVLDGFGGAFAEWTIEEFFADMDERQLVLDRLVAEGERADKTTFRHCLLEAMPRRAQTYFEILKSTGDFQSAIAEIGRNIHKQIMGTEIPQESPPNGIMECLLEEWEKLKALNL
jgi:hypothetical protein